MARIHESSPSISLLGHPILEGWMLKKKRKKMQGFAKRYFYLTQQPAILLSYSYSPKSKIRDSILISLASISISRKSRLIHIDSGGSLVMHIKTLTDSDFLRWTHTLQSLLTLGPSNDPNIKPRHLIHPSDHHRNLNHSSHNNPSHQIPSFRPAEIVNFNHSLSKMQIPLAKLEAIQDHLKDFLVPPSKNSTPAPPSMAPRRASSPVTSTPINQSHRSTSPNKSSTMNSKGKKSKLFKNYSHHPISSYTDGQKLYEIVNQAFIQIKTEHSNLVDLINLHRLAMASDRSSVLTHSAPLPSSSPSNSHPLTKLTTANLSSPALSPSSGSPSDHQKNLLIPKRSATVKTKLISKDQPTNQSPISLSRLTSDENDDINSDHETVFHDARDDDLIFVDLDLINNEQENELDILGSVDQSSANDSESDLSESSEDQIQPSSQNSHINHHSQTSISTIKDTITSSFQPSSIFKENHQADIQNLASFNSSASSSNIKRRNVLPSTITGDDFSLFSMLKKNIGKDLSQISFPISFNEPLSALQKLCEEFEYADELLTMAVKSQNNPIERLVYIVGFVVSGYCSSKTRFARKPFNPMLGETFECIRPDKKIRFISEKVVHHPPTMAAYAEGEQWTMEINSSIRQKFWGQSLEIIPEGLNRLTISDKEGQDVYEWDKPSSFVRNLVSGTKYLEHIGKVTVTNQNNRAKATIEFKPGTTFGGEASRNKVEAKIYDEDGKVQVTISGKWDHHLIRADSNEVVLASHPLPERSNEFYGFTKFAIELNELTQDLIHKLPKTDSRLRPDQRAFEEGRIDKADEIKKILEESQRNRRKDGQQSSPTWFKKLGQHWIYKGGYFENRLQEKCTWDITDENSNIYKLTNNQNT
ncbi:hypothetical protein O181_043901 [Austropuccinia psidii MF-1]|uniref:PH domain-containing protein n=1 Tax=Austropuccinia psidii MF-1 TaxID=1389203 RepID=A0A9Q3DPE4_9BASI|nr:hypothetical protein [Austropuccinia psidii MF-1]